MASEAENVKVDDLQPHRQPRMRRPIVLFVLASASLVAACLAAPVAAEPIGLWLTEGGKSRVKIEPCAERLCGTIVWLREDLPGIDARNEGEALRARPILGITLIAGFKPSGEARWNGGTIYNPEDGRTYDSKIELADPHTLRVSGCVLFFCKAQHWTRVE
ncbi:MAG: DUF2147 domain-containing protein [Alphaproteobacteria bacterium]|nr:DUF2147 domain-containing protein [Alphaproteobacteria bacterium]